MKMFRKLSLSLSVFLAIAILLPGCQGSGKKGEKSAKEKTLTMAYVNWAEGIAMTYLTKAIFEDQGYKVTLKNADVAPVFAALARGGADVFMDTWLPVTHKTYMEEYGDKLEVLGTNYKGARIGLVVPTYVDINSIDQMNSVKDRFNGDIVGIDAGAGIMKTTDKAIEEYNLDYNLQASSEAAMVASLRRHIKNKEWIVVTGWAPHYMFARYDLKFLDDPKGIYGEEEVIKTTATKGFSERDPYAAKYFANFSMTDKQLGDLMGVVADAGNDTEAAVRGWMKENMDLVNSWLPQKEEMSK